MNSPTPAFVPVGQDELDWLGTDPVPAKPYYEPEWFELEREAVFRRSWQQIGHVCELPESGSFIRRELEVLGASLLITRGKDGEIRAFHNVCTHRGTILVDEDAGKRNNFSCPYHMWTFGLDGGLISAPDFESFHVSKAECALPQVVCEVVGGLIFVHLGKPESSLREWLGPYAAKLEMMPVARATTFSEYVYDIDANWKLTYDNFQENYHLRFIHPSAAGPVTSPENPFAYPAAYDFHGPHRSQRIWTKPDMDPPTGVQAIAFQRGAVQAMADGILGTETAKDYLGLFPNFFLFGSPMQHFSHTVYPIAVNKSRGVIRLYWIGEDETPSERFAREYFMATARDVHTEDRAVIERGQKGLASGAIKHIHFQTQESLCRHLFNTVNEKVAAYRGELQAQGAAA
ncbi:aromatic ring-hydroxylating oxygenase subunit alpha [Novosphingobium malaysiense]|uniref:(2Fe-2S)-binding protein n=1 Tax=Novosphingobium malaysiense TaxID=1348853 RepID=A0A0B1ZL87_9SPHN|nr:aromatic ring-hydroxylating dioxygenase subunit alpha [Novosphingobium malaysiense]KHK91870.1 (2Fe-2S)-binding protein [Novosphingobium malaysiense]